MSINNILNSKLSALNTYAHFKCNDDAGNTVVTDDGSGSNNGVASTNTSNLSVVGKINDGFEFNGIDEYININDLWTDISSDITGSFSLWLFPISGITFIGFGDTDQNDFLQLQYDDSAEQIDIYLRVSGLTLWGFQINNITSNTWFHLVLTHNGTTPALYVNGQSDSANFWSTLDKTAWLSALTGVDNGRVGCLNYNNTGNHRFFQGSIDDIRYYKSILTLSDAQFLYNSGNGREDEFPVVSKILSTSLANISKILDVSKS